MNTQELGELIGTVRAIKENTDKIPALTLAVGLHESRINSIEPKVERHERTTQRAFGIAAVMGALSGFLAQAARSMGHGP